MQNYMKKNEEEMMSLSADELISRFCRTKKKLSLKFVLPVAGVILLGVLISMTAFVKTSQIPDVDGVERITLAINPVAATSAKRERITIPSGTVKANPFLPYRNIGGDSQVPSVVNDVPKFDLIAPPEIISDDSEAARVMDTIVSGILYDKFSPSAILNIEGQDYLVKKGDTVNNYQVVSISQDAVTVKLGKNTFKAGIGEILTEGSVKYNEVSNLNKKFGGERR